MYFYPPPPCSRYQNKTKQIKTQKQKTKKETHPVKKKKKSLKLEVRTGSVPREARTLRILFLATSEGGSRL